MASQLPPLSGSKGKVKVKESTVKAVWDDAANTLFINLCVNEIRAGNRPHTHFNKIGWEHIISKFNERTGRSYSRIQFKNHWDVLKKDWTLWQSLRKGETGIGWDAAKKTILASDSWWEAKLQRFPDAAKFRERGLANEQELDICFSDVAATGEYAWTPNSGVLPPAMQVEDLSANTPVDLATDDDDMFDIQTPNDPSPVEANRKRQKKITGAAKIGKALDRLVEFCQESSSVNSTRRESSGFSIGDCIKAMSEIPEIRPGDAIYMCGLKLFHNKAHRETFMQIPEEIRYQYIVEYLGSAS